MYDLRVRGAGWGVRMQRRKDSMQRKKDSMQRQTPAAAAKCLVLCVVCRVGQNCISAPYMTLCMVISLLKMPYVHRIYLKMHGSGQP